MDEDFYDDLTELPETDLEPTEETQPEQIGRYRLLDMIGEGGMGQVFLAEQSEPVRRRVALKVIKLGMDTKDVVARFEAERQALAVMDHPCIAQVHDAGATQTGRPYFVMELVRGVPITQYCDQHELSLHERLELFISVCQGVQHAHQKGVIHRDLKPSNILVGEHEGGPSPKIIDFGVAKAAGQQLTEKTLFTASGQVIGTPEYMSPEQANYSGLDIDTRADIYSLGVVLYDLLTGELPFGNNVLRKVGFVELQRKICQEDPPRPSTRLTRHGEGSAKIANQRHTDPGSLVKEVRGDLDWIVMKALEKDRTRRYETANDLAQDLRRFLSHEPIQARPPSARYRMMKFIRRNRLGVALVSLLVVAMLAGSVGTAIGFFRAQHEARRATTVTEFITDMLSAVNPEEAKGRDVTVREVLDEAAADVSTSFPNEPDLEADLRVAIGRTYSGLGIYDEGQQHLERSVTLYEQTLGRGHPKTIDAANRMGRNYLGMKKYEEAAAQFEKLLPICREVFGEEHADTLTMMQNLIAAYLGLGRHEQAEPLQVHVLEARREALGNDNPQTTASMNNLAHLYMDTGRYDQAEPLFREGLEIRRGLLGPDHWRTLVTTYNLGDLYLKMDRYDQAQPLFQEALAGFLRIFGEDHPYTLVTMSSSATNLLRLGRIADAEPLAFDSYERHVARYGPDHEETVAAIELLVELYEASERPESAAQWRARLPRS